MSLPDALRTVYRRFVSLVRREQLTAELEEEMRLHVQLRRDRLVAEGLAPRDAELEARRRFGSTITMTERSHDAWGSRVLDALGHDWRYAVRGLIRTPGASAMIVVTLALGLGVNAAVLSLLDRLFLRPPAGVVAPNEVRRLYLTHLWGPSVVTRATFNNPQWLDLHSATDPSLPTAIYATDTVIVGSSESPRRLVAFTDANYWPMLGVRMLRGRAFDSTETTLAAPRNVAIVSDAYWRANLDARDDALGSTIEVARTRYTIVGIAPPHFSGIDLGRVDVWLPLGALSVEKFGEGPWYTSRGVPMLQILVREPRAERLIAASARWTSAFRAGSVPAGYRDDTSAVISTGPILAALGPHSANQEILITTRLAWVALFVLLIACANVANLLVVRSLERRREIAVRLAMGVSRRRLASQMLVESALLAAIAAAGAIAAGTWAGVGLRRLLLPDVRWDDGLIDPRLAVATVIVAGIVAAAICIAPLLQTRRIDVAETLKGVASGPSARRGRNGFVIVQTAFATVLLCGAALFVQSLRRIAEINLGYDVSRVVYVNPFYTTERGGEDDARANEVSARMPEIAEHLAHQPGVARVALASYGPMGGYAMTDMRVPGRDSIPRINRREPTLTGVGPGYWDVVGLRAVRGRLLNDEDRVGSQLAIVVNETMARIVWPGADPLAQCVYPFGLRDACYAVVGVVSDAHLESVIEEPTMQSFISTQQVSPKGHRFRTSSIVIRASTDNTADVSATIRRAFREMLPSVEPGVRTLSDRVSSQERPWRLGMLLFSALGILALVVAGVGVYSVLAYSVSRRTREIGVRMALGAQRARVMRLITLEGARVVAVGVALGIVIAVVSAPVVESLLYGTSARNPAVFGVMAVVMLIAAVVASLVPAWRAGTVDPTVAMRSE